MLAPASVQVAAGACSREGVGLGSGGLLVAEGTLVSYEPKAQVRCPEAPTPNQEQPQVQAARLRSPQTPGSHGGWRLWLPPDRESGRQVKALAQGHGKAGLEPRSLAEEPPPLSYIYYCGKICIKTKSAIF